MPVNNRPFRPVPKPVKQEKPVNKRIKPKSDKRVKQDRIYLKLRDEYLTANTVCEAKLLTCTYSATEIHHTHSGTDRNKYYLITPTWMGVCRNCHNEIHNNPKRAKELGYLM